ncbi:ATP-binding protein [Leptospira ellisii]|uniref:histidine kinase n=4 Tax=Leptospira ellisii TaxID=2023197 RepID=A0AAE4U1D5_9LEPT|nr:ATP-binding protein [Leptospira ellisii]MDV6237172.1 ATP-binding protein [Leptospira ellisii]
MGFNRIRLITVLICIAGSGVYCDTNASLPAPVQNGRIDLSAWNPSLGPIELNGNWEFCWNVLIPPDADESVWEKNCNGYFPVPSYWKFYEIEGENLSPFGKATYRLKIRLPDSYPNPYGILWTEILSAFDVSVNDRSIAAVGTLGDSYETMTPELRPGLAYVGIEKRELVLVLRISNFNHENHGIWQPIFFGDWETLRKKQSEKILTEAGGFSAVFLMGLYHLVVFLFRRRSAEYMYFGLFCVFMAARQVSLENHIFLMFFHKIGFDSYIRFIHAVILANGISMCLFLKSLFSKEIPSLFIVAVLSVFICFGLSLFLPVRTFTGFFFVAYALIAFLPFGFAPFLVRAKNNGHPGALTILVAYSVFTATVINDILFALGYISTGYISQIGIVIFILLQAIVLAKKLTETIRDSEKLRGELESTLEQNGRAHRRILELKEEQKSLLETEVASRTEELEKARSEAEQANKIKSQFLAAMSHEIRTPLNGILGLTEEFKSTTLDKNQKHLLQLIQGSGDTLLKIINDILDFSKLEADKIELEIENFSWGSLVGDLEGVFLYQTKRKGLALEVRFSPDFAYHAAGDEHKIKQILANLLSNAVKFTETGKIEVDLSSKRIPEIQKIEYNISIKDTGVGIPKDKFPLLFQKFHQLDSSISRKYGGTGLGLAISKKLTELMQGSIRASAAPEGGSLFEVVLPLSETAPSRPSPFSGDVDLSGLSPDIRVLIAEDDSTNVFLLSNILKKLNIRHDVTHDGLETIEKAKSISYDLIFMDVNMPRLDGIGAAQVILNDLDLSKKPIIIAVTADVLETDKMKCVAAGMSDFLGKPYSKKDIERLIRIWLIDEGRSFF